MAGGSPQHKKGPLKNSTLASGNKQVPSRVIDFKLMGGVLKDAGGESSPVGGRENGKNPKPKLT